MEKLKVPARPGFIVSALPEIYFAHSIKDLLDSREQVISGFLERQQNTINSAPVIFRPMLDLGRLAGQCCAYVSYLASDKKVLFRYIPAEFLCWTMMFSAHHSPARDISPDSRTITLYNDKPPAEIAVKVSELLVANPPYIKDRLMSLDELRNTDWKLGVRLKNEYKPDGCDRHVLVEVVRPVSVEARGLFLKHFLRRTAEAFCEEYS